MKLQVRNCRTNNKAARILLSALLVLCMSSVALAQAPEQSQIVSDLQKQMEAMRVQMDAMQDRIQELEAKKVAENPGTASAQPVGQKPPAIPEAPPSPHAGEATATYQTFSEDSLAVARFNNVPLDPKYHGFFILPGTQTLLKIGGFFKTDLILDPRQAGNPDEFIPSSIPVPAVQGVNNANVSMRPTRLNLDFRIPFTQLGEVRFYVEGDFFGSTSTTPRLRHAYGQARNFLVGQTFTNFMDPDAFPDTLDFMGPNGMANLRNPQFRYTVGLSKGTVLSVSIEKPTSDISFKTPQFSAQPNSPSPDGMVRVRQEFQRGHWQVASAFRSIAAFLPDGRTDSVFGWGVNASGTLRVFHGDNLIVEGTYGHGISRYLNDTAGLGIDAAVISVAKPHLKATPATAAVFGYQHYWTKRLRSNLVYSFAQVQNTPFQPGSIYHKSDYSAANIIWNPLGSLNVGTEFLYGWQQLKNGQSGNAPRIQFSAKYTFVMIDRDKK